MHAVSLCVGGKHVDVYRIKVVENIAQCQVLLTV
jgi:hypothetical protein